MGIRPGRAVGGGPVVAGTLAAVLTLAACGVDVGTLPGGATTSAPAPAGAPSPMPGTECAGAGDPLDTGADMASRCERVSAEPVTGGEDITVDLGSGPSFVVGEEPWGDPETPPHPDPTWQLRFYSLDWLPPLVRRARQDDDREALDVLLSVVDRFYREHPDHGGNETGWDEGTSLRRLEALTCLYRQVPDDRIAAAMAHEADVLLGDRYYGPPHHPVHNHGLLANMRLIEAGTLTDRPEWVQTARARIQEEAPHAFSALGTSLEQSSAYQFVNATIWAGAGRRLAEIDADDPMVDEIRATVGHARQVGAWFTEPDGDIVQIGDARRMEGRAPDCPTTAGVFRDDEAGYVVGRWSWTDPDTSYYSLRYGPARRSHGHHDQGSLTWTTGGLRILTGTGFYGYDQGEPLVPYAWSPQAANAARPTDAAPGDGGFTLVDADAGADSPAHRWDLEGEPFGERQHRTVIVDDAHRQVAVTDSLAGPAGTLEQRWQLAPGWRLASGAATGGGDLQLTHPDGAGLAVRTTGRITRVLEGSTDPVGGWVFPEPGQREAAPQLVIAGGNELSTEFAVVTQD